MKEIGKDLWKVTKSCFRKKDQQPERGGDKIEINIDVEGEEFKASLSLGDRSMKDGTTVEKEAELFLTERIGDFGRHINATLERAKKGEIPLNHLGKIPRSYRSFM